MNDSIKSAMALAMPDNLSDPRDGMFRAPHTSQAADPDVNATGPAAPALSQGGDQQEQERQQEKQRKSQALRPLA